ncbi:MAG: hypothetical protein ACXADW_19945 [Candidatus Hodarchaeales archaeon]
MTELPWEWKDRIDKSLIGKINEKIYGLPRFVVKINEIKKMGTAGKLYGQAWTQYNNLNHKFTTKMNSFFSVDDPEDIQKAVNMVANYKQFLESPLIGGSWNIDVEFDETKDWFSSKKYRVFPVKKPDYGADLFGLYYANPWGRILLDENGKVKRKP